jgi:hypothetical protein
MILEAGRFVRQIRLARRHQGRFPLGVPSDNEHEHASHRPGAAMKSIRPNARKKTLRKRAYHCIFSSQKADNGGYSVDFSRRQWDVALSLPDLNVSSGPPRASGFGAEQIR